MEGPETEGQGPQVDESKLQLGEFGSWLLTRSSLELALVLSVPYSVAMDDDHHVSVSSSLAESWTHNLAP